MAPASRRAAACCAATTLLLLAVQCAADTRICLNMIMKDEKDNLEKCLDLIGPELSGWTLCDTGSSDGSPQLAEAWFKKARIPGKVVNHTWKDFSANRNLCIQAGMKFSRNMAKKKGMPKGSHYCDYMWFLDVDQFLHLPPGAKPGDLKAMSLTKPVYYMMERGVGIAYQNVRLASTSTDWEWVGEVHEYVQRKDGVWQDRNDVIPGYWLEHDASGGNDGKRFIRDETILSRVVKERPHDPRARFYLANTFRALGRTEEAITHYIKRIQLGGWEEERFMSAINIASLVKNQYSEGQLISPQVVAHVSNWDASLYKANASADAAEEKEIAAARAAYEALSSASSSNSSSDGGSGANSTAVEQASALLQKLVDARKARTFNTLVAAYTAAMQLLPYRPEPWAKLARIHRLEHNDFERCYSYASAGLAMGEPKVDALFLDSYAMRYELLDEACTCGYYVDRVLPQGQVSCRRLEQRLVEDLELEPDSPLNEGLRKMLERVRGNLGWYDKKGGCAEGADTCAWKAAA